MIFRDRTHAGQVLAGRLEKYANRPNCVVLGLPRGGVPVAFEIANALKLPLDIFVVRKLGVPGHEELAMGAVASGGARYINRDVVEALGIEPQTIRVVSEQEELEIARRDHAYRGQRPPLDVRGQTVILVDDGLATGSTMRVAIAALRQRGPARIVVAVPAGASEVCAEIDRLADETICALTPHPFEAVGQWYEDFSQTTDQNVRELLSRSSSVVDATHFSIPIDGSRIQGDLTVSGDSKAFVIFAHGSGSSRHSPRNKYVARSLNRAGLATLLVDLLTVEEENADMHTRQYRFDIELLANRLVIATDWLVKHRAFSTFPVGIFGASTGAAAALVAAARRPNIIQTVVSRGGRPDLAGDALKRVIAPVLLIVGELDEEVLELNRDAAKLIRGHTEIQIVGGATHLFEENGALEEVATLACQWFTTRMIHTQAA
jgi:putative phosphoribosyl transferase